MQHLKGAGELDHVHMEEPSYSVQIQTKEKGESEEGGGEVINDGVSDRVKKSHKATFI